MGILANLNVELLYRKMTQVKPHAVKNLSSQLTHSQLTLELTESSFWGHLVSLQWIHKMSSHWELAMCLQLTPWACCELFVRSSWWAQHAMVAVSSLCELQAHRKLIASSQCGLILWVHCKLTKCPQNELSVSFNVSWQWVSYELNFFILIVSLMKFFKFLW